MTAEELLKKNEMLERELSKVWEEFEHSKKEYQTLKAQYDVCLGLIFDYRDKLKSCEKELNLYKEKVNLANLNTNPLASPRDESSMEDSVSSYGAETVAMESASMASTSVESASMASVAMESATVVTSSMESASVSMEDSDVACEPTMAEKSQSEDSVCEPCEDSLKSASEVSAPSKKRVVVVRKPSVASQPQKKIVVVRKKAL